MSTEPERLIVVGNGRKECWEGALFALSDSYELSLVSGGYPTWQSAYVEKHRVADTSQYGSLFEAITQLRGEVAFAGLLAIDAPSLPPLALAAHKLRLRFIAPDTARLCADPAVLAAALAKAGVPTTSGPPELLVHSVVIDGVVIPVSAARLAETADGEPAATLVAGWRRQEWSDHVTTVLPGAHQAVGADWGVTATGLRMVEDELRVTGLAPWLGEEIAHTRVGVDLARIAAEIAFEREPDPITLERLAAGSTTS